MTAPLTIPRIREAWAELDPTTLTAAATDLGLTVRAIKQRRYGDPLFPDPIPVAGFYNAGSIFLASELDAWKATYPRDESNPRTRERRTKRSETLIQQVEPAMLSGAAAELLDLVLYDWTDLEIEAARADVERFRANRATTSLGVVIPTALDVATRRLRNARDNGERNGFPSPLPLRAVYTEAASVFSTVEVCAWLSTRPNITARPTADVQ